MRGVRRPRRPRSSRPAPSPRSSRTAKPAPIVGRSDARIACRAGGAVDGGDRTVWTRGLTSDGSGVTSLTSRPTTVDPDWGGGVVGRTRGALVPRFLDAVVRWGVDAWDVVLGEGVVAVDVLVDVVVVVVELVVVVLLSDVVD
jgi:hypothetical protein